MCDIQQPRKGRLDAPPGAAAGLDGCTLQDLTGSYRTTLHERPGGTVGSLRSYRPYRAQAPGHRRAVLLWGLVCSFSCRAGCVPSLVRPGVFLPLPGLVCSFSCRAKCVPSLVGPSVFLLLSGPGCSLSCRAWCASFSYRAWCVPSLVGSSVFLLLSGPVCPLSCRAYCVPSLLGPGAFLLLSGPVVFLLLSGLLCSFSWPGTSGGSTFLNQLNFFFTEGRAYGLQAIVYIGYSL